MTDRGGARSEHDVGDDGAQLGIFEDRILTVPNAITIGRLCLLPLFLWLLFAQEDRVAAAIVLAIAGGTDFFDGYIARHFDQGSELGKVLDPVADRLLFFVGVTAIMIDGAAPAWLCIAVLARETVVASATLALAAVGAPRIDVTWWGKAGTFALMCAFPWFLGGAADIDSADFWETIAWMAAIPGLFLSYLAAFLYLPLAKRALDQAKAADAGDPDRGGPEGG